MNRLDPGIICLQETKLGNSNYNPGLNYAIYKSPPPINERAMGGTAIIVKSTVQHKVININNRLQAAVIILFKKYKTICSLYLPTDLM